MQEGNFGIRKGNGAASCRISESLNQTIPAEEKIRVSQIEDCMRHLRCAADELESRISALASRIEPILMPDIEKDGHPAGQPAPPRAPLAAEISAVADRLDFAIRFVNQIYNRIEV